MNLLLLLLLILTIGCSFQSREKSIVFKEKKVKEATLILNPESSHEVGAPSEIKAVPGGFLVYDYGVEKIFKLDHNGNKLLSFGNSGRGPGEFQDIFGLWEIDEEYWVYDYNSAKYIIYDHEGKWIKDLALNFDEFPKYPVRVEVIVPYQFVVPSGGKDGSLFKLVDMEAQNIQYLGDALGAYMYTRDSEEAHQAISAGRIPADMQNAIMLSSNQAGIFLFQQTTAILEKYSHAGELLWQKSVKVPAIEGLFEHLFRENPRRINRGEFLLTFNYGKRISANRDGVAVLLNVPEEEPVTVAWVSNSGEDLTIVTFPGIENKLLGLAFTLSTDGSYMFFVDALEGKLYRAEWPL